MKFDSNETSNKRNFNEDKVEEFSFNTNKRVRIKEPNKESIEEFVPARYPLQNSCPEGLYNPEEDLEEQFNTEGTVDCTKRHLFLKGLNITTLRYRSRKRTTS